MRTHHFRISMLLLAVFATGCANLTSINRTTELDFDEDTNPSGKAIHLDAKQRLVIQKDFGVICAEPSPDALASVAASLGASFSDPSDVSAALNAVLGESAGSIGLRTQSIQLMRDALYRVCELYYGKALNDTQVMMLHQKYQDVMVAVLAIEQLTGAIVPQSVGISSSASGDALSRTMDLAKAVEDANKKVTEAKNNLANAEKSTSEKDAALKEAKTNLATLEAKQNPKASASEISAAKQKVSEAEKSLETAKNKQEEAENSLENAEKRLQAYKDAENAALASVSAEASGKVSFEGGSVVHKIDSSTADSISGAVKEIVNTVLNKEYTEESCIGIIADLDDLNKYQRKLHGRYPSLFDTYTRGAADTASDEYLSVLKNEYSRLRKEYNRQISQDTEKSKLLDELREISRHILKYKILVKQNRVIDACLEVIARDTSNIKDDTLKSAEKQIKAALDPGSENMKALKKSMLSEIKEELKKEKN